MPAGSRSTVASCSADVISAPRDSIRYREGLRQDPEREEAAPALRIVVVARRPVQDGNVELVERRGQGRRTGGRDRQQGARAIEHYTGKETRTLVSGASSAGRFSHHVDRLLALRFGAAAGRAIAEGTFGVMVGLKGPGIEQVPLKRRRRPKNVPLDSDTIATARELGTNLGD